LKSEYMYAVVEPCKQEFPDSLQQCEQDDKKWNEVVERTKLTAIWRNKYFDFSEFKESPIKNYYSSQFHGL